MVAVLIMSAKLITLCLFKIKVFLNEHCAIIISIHGIANKLLLPDLNYIAGAVIQN